MKIADKMYKPPVAGVDFPKFKGKVTVKLHNVHNGKNEVYESHNAPTNALADIFAGNFGGLLNYNNFASMFSTWLGGVLVFGNQLDPTVPNNYGIPDRVSNPCRAHAGQTPLTDQADDLTRGNPDSSQTVLTGSTTKLAWEWGTSAGNGVISSLGLTHSDVGSYGCGVASVSQASLNPFAEVGCISKTYSRGDNANAPYAIHGNMAYGFYVVNATTVDVFKTPINSSKFKLQGASLEPITDYTTKITATVQSCSGNCYYHFDFTADTLTIWRVPTTGGTTLLQDVINLSNGTVTSTSITVTGAALWNFVTRDSIGTPIRALVHNGYLYVYGYTSDQKQPNKLYGIELANTANIVEVDTSDFSQFYYSDYYAWYQKLNYRITALGGILVHDNYLINGNKTFGLNQKAQSLQTAYAYGNYGAISSPVFGIDTSANVLSVCKLYLATKYNLPSAVTKTSAQSMTVTYELTEV